MTRDVLDRRYLSFVSDAFAAQTSEEGQTVARTAASEK
jgi:hypothetical protein